MAELLQASLEPTAPKPLNQPGRMSQLEIIPGQRYSQPDTHTAGAPISFGSKRSRLTQPPVKWVVAWEYLLPFYGSPLSRSYTTDNMVLTDAFAPFIHKRFLWNLLRNPCKLLCTISMYLYKSLGGFILPVESKLVVFCDLNHFIKCIVYRTTGDEIKKTTPFYQLGLKGMGAVSWWVPFSE